MLDCARVAHAESWALEEARRRLHANPYGYRYVEPIVHPLMEEEMLAYRRLDYHMGLGTEPLHTAESLEWLASRHPKGCRGPRGADTARLRDEMQWLARAGCGSYADLLAATEAARDAITLVEVYVPKWCDDELRERHRETAEYVACMHTGEDAPEGRVRFTSTAEELREGLAEAAPDLFRKRALQQIERSVAHYWEVMSPVVDSYVRAIEVCNGERSTLDFRKPERVYDGPTHVYYARVSVEGGPPLYKIGITGRKSVRSRFNRKSDAGIVDILCAVTAPGKGPAYCFEQELIHAHKEKQYVGAAVLRGGGNTELFVEDVLDGGARLIGAMPSGWTVDTAPATQDGAP